MNNADLTVQELQKLQEFVILSSTSQDDIIRRIEQVKQQANKASRQINQINSTLNRIINALEDSHMFCGNVVSAFTGLPDHLSKQFEKKLSKAKENLSE